MDGASPTADSVPNSGGSPKNYPGGEQGVDFSGTNNQEQGVDEADFVKTDGSFVYMLNKVIQIMEFIPQVNCTFLTFQRQVIFHIYQIYL